MSSGSNSPILTAVVAIADNGVIGRNGELPWRMPSDLKWFKKITLGKPVIMGRATYQSIGKPLPKRLNIVLTRSEMAATKDMIVTSNPSDALRVANSVAISENCPEICVIGGAQIYEAFFPKLERIYLTRIHGEVEGDRNLDISATGWSVTQISEFPRSESNEFDATVERWDRTPQRKN